jgi:capsular exopolysaccharide synthesis family protein
MSTSSAVRARIDLKEAIREIHITAGLDERDGAISIGVTSPNVGDGKTTVAMALAASLTTDFSADVLLVDADLHTQSVAREFGLEDEAGLSELVEGTATMDTVRHRIAPANMSVITAGRSGEDPARIARSDRLASVMERFKTSTQYVVVDLPATLHSMTAPVLAKRCDGVVVVVDCARTSRAELERTLHLLRDVTVLGVVINRSRSKIPGFVERALNLNP